MKRGALYAVIICALIAGTNGLMIKYMSSMTASSMAWFRATIPAGIFTVWMLQNKIPFFRGNYKKMLGASVINAGRIYLYLVAFIYTSIGNAVILFYAWPIFVSILSVLFLKEEIDKYRISLLFLAFSGLILAYSNQNFSFEDQDFIGMLAAVGASIGYAITVIIYKSESNNYDKNELIFYQNVASVFLFFPLFFQNLPEITWNHLGMAGIYGFLIGVVVFSLFFYGLKQLNASTASSLMYLEVVSAIILGFIFRNEVLSINMVVGGSLIILSSFLLTRRNKKTTASD
ncbi:MAG: DMT family transporter [Saprospiraceae bacterium]